MSVLTLHPQQPGESDAAFLERVKAHQAQVAKNEAALKAIRARIEARFGKGSGRV